LQDGTEGAGYGAKVRDAIGSGRGAAVERGRIGAPAVHEPCKQARFAGCEMGAKGQIPP